jgi:hypothetical protein
LGSPTFWAEDGTVFFTGQYLHGWAPFDTYAGYVLVIPRTLAALLSWVPISHVAQAYYLTACLASALAVGVVLQSRMSHILGPWRFRLGVALGLACLPAVAEIQGSLANLQWWLALSLMVLLAAPVPRSVVGRAAELAYCALAGLTGFAGFFVIPLAVRAVRREPSAYAWARLGVLVATGAVQLVSVLAGPDRRSGGLAFLAQTPALPAEVLVKRIGAVSIVGERNVGMFWQGWHWSWLAIPAILVLVLAAWVAVHDGGGPSRWWLVTGVAYAIVAVYLSSIDFSPERFSYLLWPLGAGRYFSVGVAAVLLVLARAAILQRSTRAVVLSALVASLIAFSGDAQLPPWPAQPLEPFAECMAAQASGRCTLVVAPGDPWVVDLPASRPG